jgi:hypothetical protein
MKIMKIKIICKKVECEKYSIGGNKEVTPTLTKKAVC